MKTNDNNSNLHVVQEGGKYGYADEQGNIVIPCTWKEVGEFIDGMAPICNDKDRWGYIDTNGKIVVPCEWYDATHFRKGLGMVSGADRLFYLYVDRAGEFVCSDVFSEESALKIYESKKLAEKGQFKEAIELVYSVLYPIFDEDATALRLLIQYSIKSKQFETMVNVLEALKPLRYGGTEWDVLYIIGELYKEGLGVKQNFAKAYEWFKKASICENSEIGDATKAMEEILNEHPEIREELKIPDITVDLNDPPILTPDDMD